MSKYRIVPFGEDEWWIVEQVGDTSVLKERVQTHKEALEVRRSLLNEQPMPDEYDYYIEM